MTRMLVVVLVLVLVLVFGACAAEREAPDGVPRATCREFFDGAHAIVVSDPPGTTQEKTYRCAVELDPALRLPGTVVPVFYIGGSVFPLLTYQRGAGAVSFTGVFGFKGDPPELHPNDACEWVEIDMATCTLYP